MMVAKVLWCRGLFMSFICSFLRQVSTRRAQPVYCQPNLSHYSSLYYALSQNAQHHFEDNPMPRRCILTERQRSAHPHPNTVSVPVFATPLVNKYWHSFRGPRHIRLQRALAADTAQRQGCCVRSELCPPMGTWQFGAWYWR